MSNIFDPIERPTYGAPSQTYTITMQALPFRDPGPPHFSPPCAFCQFPLPFRLLLRDGEIAASLADEPVHIILREVKQEAFDKRTVIAKAEGTELARDRTGIVYFTDVEVQFPYSLVQSQHAAQLVGFSVQREPDLITTDWLDSLHGDMQRVAIYTVNQLIRAYRYLTGQYHVRPITLHDIFYFQTGWLIPRLNNPFSMAIGAPGQAITIEAHPLSDEFHNFLARWLQSGIEVPLWTELFQDAREYLDVGRFRHVVIDARTALEVYLDQTLLACFARDGATPAEVARILRLPRQQAATVQRFEDAVEYARVNDKLKHGVNAALNIRLARRTIWNEWLTAKELRERGVHYGSQVSAEQAASSLETVEELMNAIHVAGSPVSAELDRIRNTFKHPSMV